MNQEPMIMQALDRQYPHPEPIAVPVNKLLGYIALRSLMRPRETSGK